MPSWILVPCLVALRDEFDTIAPNRSKASDGSIGDDAHSQSSSDHNPDETGNTPYEDADSRNEVHAIDVTVNLREEEISMEACVQVIVGRHRLGSDNRLQNVIYNERIWSASWGWTERSYRGSNPHKKHAHFSSRYTDSAESSTRSFGLIAMKEDISMPSAADVARELKKIMPTPEQYAEAVIDRLYAVLTTAQPTRLELELRRLPLQYVGGPFPEGMSLAWVFENMRRDLTEIKASLPPSE